MTRSELPRQMRTVYLVGLGGALLVPSGYVRWVYDQYLPACFGGGMVNGIAHATGFITALHLVLWIMLRNISNQNVGIGFGGEAFQYQLLLLDGYGPCFLMDIQSNKKMFHNLPPDF